MSLRRLHYDTFAEYDCLFDGAFNARVWPPNLINVGCTSIRATESPDTSHPRMNIQESKDNNTITATFDLPGTKSEDIKIDLQQTRLTVSGESSSTNSRDGGVYAARERRYGKFSRTLQLPIGTKPKDVGAKMENGLLTITFPKVTAEQQPHRIPIQSNS